MLESLWSTCFLSNPYVLTILLILVVMCAGFIIAYNENVKPLEFPIGLDDQSIEIELQPPTHKSHILLAAANYAIIESTNYKETVLSNPGVRYSRFAADGKLLEYIYEDCRTMHQAFLRGMRLSKNGPCLGTREKNSKTYSWLSYREVYDRIQMFGSACLHLGLQPCDETFIGIYSPNCVEWVVAQQACGMYSMVVVPLYDTLGAEACEFIINQTEMQMVICDTGKKAEMLLGTSASTKSLKFLVVIQGSTLTNEIIEQGKQKGVRLFRFEELYQIGSENLKEPLPAKPETIYTLCYTSGTTGTPKGVILTHKSIIANLAAYLVQYNGIIALSPDDTHLAYLPLAHMYEILNQTFMFQHGAKIGFNCGDIRELINDMSILQPTAFPTVPRLLNRLYDKVQQDISKSWLKRKIFELSFRRKMALLKSGVLTANSVWDWLVFGKIRKALGGRLSGCCVASAPVSGKVLDFARCAMGCYVFQAYGQTEVTAGACMTFPHESDPDHVGPPLPSCHVKLVDIPDMDYYAKDGKGEICIKSSSMMGGYYKEPEKTKEVIDEGGWVHTGDVGEWNPNGTLKLIDRKKHIFKLAQGEYVAPEKVESVYIRSPFVAQVYVDGDGLQTFPIAVVIPDIDHCNRWAKKNLNETASLESLCKNKTFKEAVLKDFAERGKEGNLKGFEQVKDIILSPEVFTVSNGLLTPSLKSKRPAVRKRYQEEIKNLYLQHNNSGSK